MQDTQAIAGEGGRLFAGGSGAGDGRRLRPAQHSHHHQQALKCPRCESLNTKFCYYNNYNLSQPRYFCKGCRRYWTKGGVLRNVPVGGGCRKNKRSSKPKNTAPSSSDLTPDPNSNSNSHSSSESSSLTTTTTAAKKASASITTATAGSSAEVGSASASKLLNFSSDSRYILDQPQPLIDPIGTSEGQIFSEMRSFTSLMTSSNDPGMLSFSTSMADIPGFGLQPSGQDQQNPTQLLGCGELKTEEQISCGGYLDQTGELSGLDWQMNDAGSGGEHGLFDFTGAVDQTYWGQNQWSDHDHDHSLNFPPLV